jgi:heptosyltransferase-2
MTQPIAIFLPNWIGDVVMATPMLRAMQRHFGDDAELIGVAKPYVAGVLEGAPWLRPMLVYDRRPTGNALSTWGLIKQLRARRVETAVLLTNSLRTAAIARLSGAKQRVGYARDWRGWLLTNALQAPRTAQGWQPISAVDYYLNLAYSLGCPAEAKGPELPLTPADRAAAEQVWQQLHLAPHRPVVAFHVAGGWGGTATAKAWPIEHFAELAQRIAGQYDHQVLVLCGPNEREAAAEVIRRAAHPRVKSLAAVEALSLSLTKGCLSRSSLLVTTDSGPRHIATALNVPVVALFGATDPAWTETYHPQAITLFNKLDCGPCKQKHCPLLHHRCMRDLSTDRVFAAVQQALATAQPAAA